MSRELRPRKSQPSYAILFQDDDDDDDDDVGEGPSQPRPTVDEEGDADSGSDFAPAEAEIEASDEEDIPDANTEPEDDDIAPRASARDASGLAFSLSAPPTVVPQLSKGRTPKGTGKRPKQSLVTLAPGLSRPLNRQMYSLPMPSVHHRHKAIPIFRRDAPVERLVRPPVLFGKNDVVRTNSYTSNSVITDRLNKAWGFNVGPGPIWEIMEDRGWFKEAEVASGAEKEEKRRPRVYEAVAVSDGWSVLTAEDAASYLPTDIAATEDGSLRPPPPVPCAFGPFGKQTARDVRMMDAFAMSEYLPESKSYVFNAGAQVWGLDWCPVHPADRQNISYTQYLAVAPFPTRAHSPEVGVKALRPFHACIQIWSLSPSGAQTEGEDAGIMQCEMVVCIESGPAYELKWCPLPTHDQLTTQASTEYPRKLGLIAGTFEDGSLSIYTVPHPADIRKLQSHPAEPAPVFVKLPQPIIRLELEDTVFWTLDWANSELIAAGCTNGSIAVYDVSQTLRSSGRTRTAQNILPTHYISVHQSAVRAISWIRAPTLSGSGDVLMDEDPTVIASGGYDGLECLTDIRDPMGNIMNRTRDVINSIPYSPYAGGPITIDHENIIKAYSVSPSMLGRGHTLMEPGGPVWSAHTSDYHPQLAVGSADGTCSTTNMLRSTRRGGSVPFLVHKIYQLDVSRATQTYRMLDRFLPYETSDRSSATARSKSKEGSAPAVATGAWSAEVGVLRVVWNTGGGLGAAPLLASATASGLCRVDYLRGRWMRGKVPYERVQAMRREDADAMDVDDDDEDDDE